MFSAIELQLFQVEFHFFVFLNSFLYLDGQLKCCGTSLFLKTTFGEGYVLTLIKKGKSNFHCVLLLISRFI
jgi:hypothetical protein